MTACIIYCNILYISRVAHATVECWDESGADCGVCGVQLTSEVGGLMRRMGRHMPPTTAENIMDRLR